MKRCSKCRGKKQLTAFYKQTTSKDGLQYWCKDCDRLYRQSDKGKEVEKKFRQSKKGRVVQRRSSKVQQLLHPERRKARRAVSHAIRDGKLKRSLTCESCKEKKFVHGHHEDYSKPLDITWLCRGCHQKSHKNERNRQNG